jgi:hypothetical protein
VKKNATHQLKRASVVEDAWAAAAAYGCDMNLLERSLQRTPAERIRVHQMALDLIEAFQVAGRRQIGRDRRARRKTRVD